MQHTEIRHHSDLAADGSGHDTHEGIVGHAPAFARGLRSIGGARDQSRPGEHHPARPVLHFEWNGCHGVLARDPIRLQQDGAACSAEGFGHVGEFGGDEAVQLRLGTKNLFQGGDLLQQLRAALLQFDLRVLRQAA